MSIKSPQEPAIGIIGGSGLYEIDSLEAITRHAISTPFGDPSDEIVEGHLCGRRVCFLPRHGLGHRLLAHEINHRANIWALRSLDVRWVVSVTAVGSLRQELAPRDVVVPDQLMDKTGKGDQHTFFGNGIAAHVGFADPYSAEMRNHLLLAAANHTARFHDGGTYVSMNGPAFSTRAESNMHRALGFDLIGMTNAGEARLCREAEIAMATLALVTDYDCWKTDEAAVDLATVMANLHANGSLAKEIIRSVVATIPIEPNWPEHHALNAAILTAVSAWPEKTATDLAPILARFFPDRTALQA
ncbi:MAG: S-methyl-5'-thioadenosine phosphorylase [Armatimonadetes bacterium]|nr:S-methyl-5'-thioadenosine phosphorylase [Akkermansiaceae bacterium]